MESAVRLITFLPSLSSRINLRRSCSSDLPFASVCAIATGLPKAISITVVKALEVYFSCGELSVVSLFLTFVSFATEKVAHKVR